MCGSYIESARLSVAAAGMKKFRRFLRSMFYIGCIGFGGGSALIPIIEQEIAEKQGLDAKQNIDKDVVVASITPGALPIEIAASIGRRGFGRKGMIAGAVMMALPGTVLTVLLVTILSVFQEQIVNVVQMVSVVVSAFIIYMLMAYIRNMLKSCAEDGKSRKRKAVALMLGIFVLSFFVSTMQVLVLAFFGIFFTRGNYCRKNMLLLAITSAMYLFTNSIYFGAEYIALRYMVNILMAILSIYGICCNIRENQWKGKADRKEIGKDVGIWLLFFLILLLPAVIASRSAIVFSGEGVLSTWTSFGGGDAYLTIADGFFVEGGFITGQQYYGYIVPAVNVLPGSILCKTLAAVGYYVGWNIGENAVVGVLFAIAGFGCSIAASCSFFMLAYHLYDYLITLQVFRIIRKWIRPMIAGLLMKVMVMLCVQNVSVVFAMIR